MTRLSLFLMAAGLFAGPAVCLPEDLARALRGADVVIAGEAHDNPAHHARQAEIAAEMRPAALVFEMLTPAQAAAAEGTDRTDRAAMAAALGWAASGWPDFAMYHPIMAAAPEAALYGAGVPREAARAALARGVAGSFGPDAGAYGLDTGLPAAEQAAREAEQLAAHCDALPAEMLPGMVALQRLRDAELARAAVRAMAATGGPVLVIAGNGHARADRGVPVYVARVAPGLRVVAVGQGEEGDAAEGAFDVGVDAPGVAREDPCAGFGE